MELEQPRYQTVTFAHALRALWPTSKHMFPWWNQANAELVRSAKYIFGKYKLGRGAFGSCQGTKALIHQILVGLEFTQYDPETFVRKTFEILEMRFCTQHDFIRKLVEEANHDLGLAAGLTDGHDICCQPKLIPRCGRPQRQKYKVRLVLCAVYALCPILSAAFCLII